MGLVWGGNHKEGCERIRREGVGGERGVGWGEYMKIRKYVILDCVGHTYQKDRTSKLVVAAPSINHSLSKLTIHH